MKKTILLTGATDGIGLDLAKKLIIQNHKLLIHGRSLEKLEKVSETLKEINQEADLKTFQADFSRISDVKAMIESIKKDFDKIDILYNNAGVFKTSNPQTEQGHDVRSIVNTISPYLLTKELLPVLDKSSRVINLSSAAQSPVELDFLTGSKTVNDFEAYAQSKLAIRQWTEEMSNRREENHPVFISVNPGSLLGSKMVKEGFGTEGKSLEIGSTILMELGLEAKHENRSGEYFDNDSGAFSKQMPDISNALNNEGLVNTIEKLLKELN